MYWLRGLYLVVFAAAAVACFASVLQARTIADRETRTGLVALLLLSGTWAAASLGRVLPFPDGVQIAFYTVGLVVGLATVGAWLYFCSAYTGHDYHRRRELQALAVTLYVAIVAVKVTNPLHGLYYSVGGTVAVPFSHTVFDLHAVHWIVTSFAYSLTAIGFYLLYELFAASRFDTRPLAVLVGLTGLPALLDVLAYTDAVPGLLVKLNFEPIGVAIFAVGVLFVVDERFVAVPQFWRERVLESMEEAVIVLDRRRCIRDYNAAAGAMFPTVATGVGEPLRAVAPDLAGYLRVEGSVFERTVDEQTRYYRIRATSLRNVPEDGTRAIICADVTDIERQRRDLERHAEQFDDFAEAITHELRNTVTIVDGYLDLVAAELTDDRRREGVPIDEVNDAVERMQSVIGDLTTLARYGQPVEESGECRLDDAVDHARRSTDVEDLRVVVTDAVVAADETRLEKLLGSAFAFAAANGATTVEIAVEDDAIVLTDDGEWLSPESVPKAFAYGEPVPEADAGMTLPNLRMLARGLGWTADVDTAYSAGVRIRLSGVDVRWTTDSTDADRSDSRTAG